MAEATEETQRSKLDTEKFLALAIERWQMCADAESEWRKLGLEDLKFSLGDQWPEKVKAKRDKKNKPCLTFNHIGQSVKQVINNQRQQRPEIQVNPAGNGATKDVAEILQGMTRHINVQSDGEIARDIAFEYMARTGKGFYRLRSIYIDDDGATDDQEIIVDPIQNPFTVYSDPRAIKPDKSDANFKFIVEDMPHEVFRSEYKNSATAALSDMSSVGDQQQEWADKNTIRVAEYFYIETEEIKTPTRNAFKKTVRWAKITALEVLEERKLSEKYIPIIEVVGDDLIVDGKRHTAGMVRDAKDPSRSYNYHVSKAAEVVALAPLAPFIGWKGQFNDPKWEFANEEDYAFLEADPITIEGLPSPSLPQRNSAEPPIAALVTMIKQADNDIKATTGLYDASLGERGPEQSGKAILQRKQQGDNANFNYTDNLVRAMRFEGRMLLDMIPIYYDAPRIQRIINPDGSTDHVGIYNSRAAGMEDFDPKTHDEFQDIKRVFDIGVGRYDVTISVGPSYQTKRQESAAMQLELMKNVPIVQQAAPDIVIRNMDIPGADVIADRVKKLLPPQLQDNDDDTPEARASSAEAKLAALTQQHQALTQALQQATEEIKTKQVEANSKAQIVQFQEASRQAIEKMKIEADLAKAEITTKAQSLSERAQFIEDLWQQFHGQAHEVAMAAQGHSNAQDMADQNHTQNLEAADQGAAHAQDAAAQQAALKPPPPEGNDAATA